MTNNKQDPDHRGVFFYLDDDGKPNDAGIVDEMLQDEDRIRRELIAAGIIREFVLENIKATK